jgi:2'-5' RNA ligase
MPDVDLARRSGVELIRTGSWSTMSGSWSPTPEDLAAAVEAQSCPAIAKPIIKLGHVDSRFDGEPAMGYFENLRLSDGGHTLLADQVTLPWLHSVQAAAYPSRSIEGNYNHTCGSGHKHKFVLTAVALLGVTPPAVKTIRRLNDIPAMLGVAASKPEVPEGAEHVEVTILAAEPASDDDGDDDDEPTGAMVALIPTAEDAARLAIDGGEPAEQLHLTLAYLGDASDLDTSGRQDLIDAVSTAVNGMPVVEAQVFSAAVYDPGDASDADGCLVYQVTGDLLAAVQGSLDDALGEMDRSPEPWFAHITALWSDDLDRLADLTANMGPVSFDRVRIAVAGQIVDIPLIDDPAPDDAPELDVPNILMPVAAASADKLREFWVHGKGAAKIRWGEKNDFYRCVKQLKRFVTDPKGLCNTYHREALGVAPGQEDVHASAEPTPDLPAAEPEQPNTEPKEDHVSDLSAFRSRLGLDDTADEQAILSALDELKTKADTPAQPDPEMVAASAAATEQAEKAQSALELMKEELARQSNELATIKASAASTVKASFFGGLMTAGKLKPADRETWEARYDRDPEMVSEILGARAEGSEVPVMASGSIGSAEPSVEDDFDALVARIDAPTGKAA